MNIKRIPDSELKGIAQAGNGFGQQAHAEAVAKARPGKEVIAKEDNAYILYAADDYDAQGPAQTPSGQPLLAFVDEKNAVKSIQNEQGIRGVGPKLKASDLQGKASDGNAFGRYGHAEAVARSLERPVAIIQHNGHFELYEVTEADMAQLRGGDNRALDGRAVALVDGNKRLYNWGFDKPTQRSNTGLAYTQNGKLMLEGEPFHMKGINVYDLADIAQNNPEELKKTLQLIADTGANTVRFWAFSKHAPETVAKILDTASEMQLPLKFIPALGNHWEHCEAPESHFEKDTDWYREGYKAHFLPHVKATVAALMERPEILMWEVMNEPEGEPEVLRDFADHITSEIHQFYADKEAETGQPIGHHLQSLGTLAIGRYGLSRPGFKGHDYKDLFALPHIDVTTAHDYTSSTLANGMERYLRYADDLDKPFYYGEVGVKVRAGGTEKNPESYTLPWKNKPAGEAQADALDTMDDKIEAMEKRGGAGALLWGPQPRGHGVDGHGYGFSFREGDAAFQRLKTFFEQWD